MEDTESADGPSETLFAWPIHIEADPIMVPAPDSPAATALLEERLPELQRHVQSSLGICLPGVLFSRNEALHGGRYRVLLHGLEVASDAIHWDCRFCPDAAGCKREHIVGLPARDPLNARDGFWLDTSTARRAIRHKLRVWEPYEWILQHLEAIISANGALLLWSQELIDLLEYWSNAKGTSEPEVTSNQKATRKALVARVAGTRAARRDLVPHLQAVLRAGLSLVDLGSVLEVYADELATRPSRSIDLVGLP